MPYLGASALCPIAALERMLATHPSHPDSPLFQIPQADLLAPLTDSAARKHLKQVSLLLGLHRSLTFHDFISDTTGRLTGYLDIQLCLAIHCPSSCPVTGFSCIQIILVFLASSPYLYWVFGALLSIIISHFCHNPTCLYYIMTTSPGGTSPLLNSRFMICLGDLDL